MVSLLDGVKDFGVLNKYFDIFDIGIYRLCICEYTFIHIYIYTYDVYIYIYVFEDV